MSGDETAKIMDALKIAYPYFSAKQSNDEKYAVACLWAKMFEDEPAELVLNAVLAFIATDTKGFCPQIGQIKEQIAKIKYPDALTEMEAWALVKLAVSNSIYNSAEEYSKLPSDIAKVVGSPSQLREWAVTDTEEFGTVVASNFMRSYRAKAGAQREYEKLPQHVQKFISQLAGDSNGLARLGEKK